MNLSLKDRVSNGIMLLDIKIVGWRDKINLDKLNIYSLDNCIFGQIFGDFIIGDRMFNNKQDKNFLYNHGFDIDQYDLDHTKNMDNYDNLTQEWKRQLSSNSVGVSREAVYV